MLPNTPTIRFEQRDVPFFVAAMKEKMPSATAAGFAAFLVAGSYITRETRFDLHDLKLFEVAGLIDALDGGERLFSTFRETWAVEATVKAVAASARSKAWGPVRAG